MTLTRRRLLGLAIATPAGMLVATLAVAEARVAVAVAGASRPAASGTSDRRCASCGSADHAMLDGACPARPRLS